MLSVSFAFSVKTQRRLVELGTLVPMASVSVLVLPVSAGFLVNLAYRLRRIRKSGWSCYGEQVSEFTGLVLQGWESRVFGRYFPLELGLTIWALLPR